MPHQCTNCGKVFPDGSKEMLSGCPECGGNKFQFRPSGSGSDRAGGSSSGTSPASGATGDPARSSRAPGSDARRSRKRSTSPRNTPPREKPTSADTSTPGGASAPAADETRPSDDSTAGPTVRGWVKKRITNRTEQPTDADEEESVPDDPSAAGEDSGPASADSNAAGADPDAAAAKREAEAREDTAQASARSDVVTPSELAEAADSAPKAPPSDVDGRVIEPKTDDRPGLDELREELNNQFESIRIISPGQYELNLMELYDRSEYIISLQEDGRYVIEVPDTWNAGEEDE